ncbi:MAG: FlgD immunoglobulin-like domain containing protein [Candidatus Marinimicrobia bacterium]|nr:FlgD immunoglobulin-like domain containing protein [Candidatus Neomarinimicrobiota bacterium]
MSANTGNTPQKFPNPFNPTTNLQYGLPEASDVDLMIFDITGRRIKSWHVSNQQAGWHKVIWDGTNQSGQQVSTGVYIYCLRADNFVDTKKMVFMK